MRAAVLRGPREMSIESVPVPQLAADEVLVKVEANGLCGSDVHCYTGERVLEYPMVLGHEIVGHIVATGENAPVGRLDARNRPRRKAELSGHGLKPKRPLCGIGWRAASWHLYSLTAVTPIFYL